MRALAIRAENALAALALGGIMLLPLPETAVRAFVSTGIPGAASFSLSLTLWVGMLGGATAAREGKLLTLATGEWFPKGPIGDTAPLIGGTAGAAIATMFAVGGAELVTTERSAGNMIALGVPVWVSTLAFPLAFSVIALRLAWHASKTRLGRATAALGIVAGFFAAYHHSLFEGAALLPWIVGILIPGL